MKVATRRKGVESMGARVTTTRTTTDTGRRGAGAGTGTGASNGTRSQGPATGGVAFPEHAAKLSPPVEQFSRDPRQFSLFPRELRRQRTPVRTVGAPLDRGTHGPRKTSGGRKKARRCEVKEEHRLFAREVIPLMPDHGVLLFVTLTTPPVLPRERQHRRFAAFCRRSGFDYLAILDWGAKAGDPDRAPGKGDGEHFHALVWGPNRAQLSAALHGWADAEGVNPRSRDWKNVTGWYRAIEFGVAKTLETNIGYLSAYMTKVPQDRPPRDLRKHARADGMFAKAWERFVCNATEGTKRSVTRRCPACAEPAPATATARWKFCSDACRIRIWRSPWKRLPKRWIVRRVRPTVGATPAVAAQSGSANLRGSSNSRGGKQRRPQKGALLHAERDREVNQHPDRKVGCPDLHRLEVPRGDPRGLGERLLREGLTHAKAANIRSDEALDLLPSRGRSHAPCAYRPVRSQTTR